MIETYLFLAAFTVQILVMAVLLPAWFIRYVRTQATHLPAERLAHQYPGVDLLRAQDRFLTQYRALTIVIAVLGVLLLGWLSTYMQRADWNDGPVKFVVTAYFLLSQLLPLLLVAWVGIRFNRAHKRAPPPGKRKAVLRRRGLFDFVSPSVVVVALLLYVLFAVFVLYIREHPFPGFAGLINIGVITLVYLVNASVVYTMLYGKKKNPLETHEGRLYTIGLAVKSCVYSCILVVVFLSLDFSLRLQNLSQWQPFALSLFLVICALVASMGYAAPLRRRDTGDIAPASGSP